VNLSGAYDWGNETVNYKLEFHIMTDFIAELEDTNSDIYRRHNETIGQLVSVQSGPKSKLLYCWL